MHTRLKCLYVLCGLLTFEVNKLLLDTRHLENEFGLYTRIVIYDCVEITQCFVRIVYHLPGKSFLLW